MATPGSKPPTVEEVHAKVVSEEILVHHTRIPLQRCDIQIMIGNIQKKYKLVPGPDGAWTPCAWDALKEILEKAKRQRRRLDADGQLALPAPPAPVPMLALPAPAPEELVPLLAVPALVPQEMGEEANLENEQNEAAAPKSADNDNDESDNEESSSDSNSDTNSGSKSHCSDSEEDEEAAQGEEVNDEPEENEERKKIAELEAALVDVYDDMAATEQFAKQQEAENTDLKEENAGLKKELSKVKAELARFEESARAECENS